MLSSGSFRISHREKGKDEMLACCHLPWLMLVDLDKCVMCPSTAGLWAKQVLGSSRRMPDHPLEGLPPGCTGVQSEAAALRSGQHKGLCTDPVGEMQL